MADLIDMTKDGERLPVHPSCVHGHLRAGWVVAEAQPLAATAAPTAPDAIAAGQPPLKRAYTRRHAPPAA